MNGYRFYLEYESQADKRKGSDNGNCLALCYKDGINPYNGCYPCFGTLMIKPSPNSNILCWSEVSQEVLTYRYKRISEKVARKVHPNMFRYLDLSD